MPYVSCRYGTVDLDFKAGDPRPVVCTDENGVEWFLTEDSKVGDWLAFIAEGNTVMAAEAPPPEAET